MQLGGGGGGGLIRAQKPRDESISCKGPPLSLGAQPAAAQPYKNCVYLQSFIVGINHSFIAPPHLKILPYYIIIARPLRNIRPPADPSFLCHTPCHIGDRNIVLSRC